MKSIALPGFGDIALHTNYYKGCLRKACGHHLCIRAAMVHLTMGWNHSSSSEPALAAAWLLNTSSITRRRLTPAQGAHLRGVQVVTIRQVTCLCQVTPKKSDMLKVQKNICSWHVNLSPH